MERLSLISTIINTNKQKQQPSGSFLNNPFLHSDGEIWAYAILTMYQQSIHDSND